MEPYKFEGDKDDVPFVVPTPKAHRQIPAKIPGVQIQANTSLPTQEEAQRKETEDFQIAAALAIKNGVLNDPRNVLKELGIIVTDMEDNDESSNLKKELLDEGAAIEEHVEVILVDDPT